MTSLWWINDYVLMWIGQTPVNDENKNNNNNNNKFNRFSLNYVIIITIILSLYSDITVFLCTSLYGECDYPSVVGFPFNVNGLFFILLFPLPSEIPPKKN